MEREYKVTAWFKDGGYEVTYHTAPNSWLAEEKACDLYKAGLVERTYCEASRRQTS